MKRKIDAKPALSLAVDLALYDKSEEIQIPRRNAKKHNILRFDYTKIVEGRALETNILLLQ